jgi:DNA-binding XRE family transcriptional regulator
MPQRKYKPAVGAPYPRKFYKPERRNKSGQRHKPAPTTALPGTSDKLRVLIDRARSGQDLHVSGDVRLSEANHLVWKILRNGAGVPRDVEQDSVTEVYMPDTIGFFVREQRLKADLSRKQLAIRASITEATLSRIERSLFLPRTDVLIALADALHVTLDSLVGREAV